MRIDVRVSKIKFEREVHRLALQSKTLKKRGVVIQKKDYPVVEAIFIPSNTLKICQPLELQPGAPLPPGISVPPGTPPGAKLNLITEFSSASARAFGARISLLDFDQCAPSVTFCDPFTWEELPYSQLHRGINIDENGKPLNVILDKHPLTKKPFLCMRGIREYHEHPQHTGDDWMNYRKYMGLFSTIDTIWRTCIFNANVCLFYSPGTIQFKWNAVGVA